MICMFPCGIGSPALGIVVVSSLTALGIASHQPPDLRYSYPFSTHRTNVEIRRLCIYLLQKLVVVKSSLILGQTAQHYIVFSLMML